MTIASILSSTSLPSLDTELLLASAMGKSREYLLAHPDEILADDVLSVWMQYEARRLNNEPVAYITGTQEFYGRPFHVTPDVLIPRPSTEMIIDRIHNALHHIPMHAVKEVDTDIVVITHIWGEIDERTIIIDVGTGSGCIAVTAALEHPDRHIIAIDISEAALNVARQNADVHGVSDRIQFRQGSLLEPCLDVSKPFLLVSNPPYIPDEETLMADVVDFEPHSALFGGSDGSDLVSQLYDQMRHHPFCIGFVIECKSDHQKVFASAK